VDRRPRRISEGAPVVLLTRRIGLLRSRFVSENVLATNQAVTPVADEAHHGRSLNRFTTVLLVGYLFFIVAFMVLKRAALTADVFVVFVSVIAVMLGRGRAFVRDWAPFLLIFLAWEAMRGVANQFGAEVQSDAVIAVERFVSFADNELAKAWGARERFIVERLDGKTAYEAIAAAWTDRGEQPMIAAQVKVFVDQLADQGMVLADG